ncbi:MAG: hypothetical protein COA84_02290 [Robiginitomaculum sp.]|nr:MAG: hypothetical protein COA84_02290 [Robiginitomaculum sp.]
MPGVPALCGPYGCSKKYELHTLAFKMGDTGGKDFAKTNPLQKAPALNDGDQTLPESVVRMDYLMGRYGPTAFSVGAQFLNNTL